MDLRPLENSKFFQCVDRLYTSESDVYRRRILMYKDSLRFEGWGFGCMALQNRVGS